MNSLVKKLLQIFLAGFVVLAPFVVTIWVISAIARWLGGVGKGMLVQLFFSSQESASQPAAKRAPPRVGLRAEARLFGTRVKLAAAARSAGAERDAGR